MSSIPTYIYFLNLAAIIIGWWVINHQNNERETRKELRQHIDRIINLLEELRNVATKHHLNPTFKNADDEAYRKIGLLVDSIEEHTNLLEIQESYPTLISALRHHCTGINFVPGLKNEDLEQPVSVVVTDINSSIENIRMELEKQFTRKYWPWQKPNTIC